MTSQELYYTFHLLLNKNNEDKNINVEPANFVILYNREAERWLSEFIGLNNSTDSIFEVSDLLVKDFLLQEIETKAEYSVYKEPEDMFSYLHGDFASNVSSGNCKSKIYNYAYKPQDINTVLEDAFTKPSFAWERGVAKITKGEIVVYKDGYDLDSTTISYYKIPRKIDLEGYINFNNISSTNINPDTSDYACNHILDRVVTEVNRQINAGLFQLAKSREKGN